MKTVLAILLSLTLLSGGDIRDRFLDAVGQYSRQEYAKARKTLTVLASESPDDDAVFFYLGMCHYYLGETDEAETFLKEAVRLDPDNSWYKESLAQLYYGLGRIDQTIALYEQLLSAKPKDTGIQYALVSLYARQGRFDKVLSTLDDIETVTGRDETVTMARYDVLLRTGRAEDAYRALEEYNEDFSSPQVLSRMADFQMAHERDSMAIALYDEALSYDSAYAPAVLGKAELLRMRGRTERYFDVLDSLALNTDVPPEIKSEYLSRMLSGAPQGFIPDHRDRIDTLLCTMVRLYPDDLVSAATRVQFLGTLGRWEEMERECEESFARFPDRTGFLTYKGIACYNQKDYKGFIQANERIIATAPADTAAVLEAYGNIGDMYHTLKDSGRSYRAYEKALKINPDYAPVLNNYAYYLALERKNLKKALAMSKKTIDANPDNSTYLDTYGWILYQLKRYEEAKPVFKHAMLYGGKDSAECLWHYGRVLEALGEKDAAKIYYNLSDKKLAK